MESSNWTVKFAWFKFHAGKLGNKLADQLAKTAVRDKDKTAHYSRIPLIPGARRRIQAKMATKVGGNLKGSANETILSKNNRQAQIENRHNIKRHSYGFRTQ